MAEVVPAVPGCEPTAKHERCDEYVMPLCDSSITNVDHSSELISETCRQKIDLRLAYM
tara:strand:+ start:5323 stop:5496 length:174 start_codon:yes stop_codon:yes gene_type:complete